MKDVNESWVLRESDCAPIHVDHKSKHYSDVIWGCPRLHSNTQLKRVYERVHDNFR